MNSAPQEPMVSQTKETDAPTKTSFWIDAALWRDVRKLGVDRGWTVNELAHAAFRLLVKVKPETTNG